MSLTPIVTLIYFQCVKSAVNHQDAEGEARERGRRLFIPYLCELVVSIALVITSIVLLETHLFYPRDLTSDFSCSFKNLSSNRAQSTYLFNCFNERACEKNVCRPNFWKRRMGFSLSVHPWLVGSSRELEMEKKFTGNRQVYSAMPLVEPQHQPRRKFHSPLSEVWSGDILHTRPLIETVE